LHPGTYDGGIEITGEGPVTLLPGLYYMNGGGFTVSGEGSVTGTNVLIVNAPDSHEDTINISGEGEVNLTALSTGPYQGVVMFQDPSSDNPVHFTGEGAVTLTGLVYVPEALVSITGNGGVTIKPGTGTAVAPPPILGALIAYDLQVTGNGALTINPDPAGPVGPSSAHQSDGVGEDGSVLEVTLVVPGDQQGSGSRPVSAPVPQSGVGATGTGQTILDRLFSSSAVDTGVAWSGGSEGVPAEPWNAPWVDTLAEHLVNETVSGLA
jgi:hypothetical protein